MDTSVLFDVFTADATHGAASHSALTRCLQEGALVACAAVWAELAAGFGSEKLLNEDMRRLGVRFVAMDEQAAVTAGRAWRSYRAAGGPRERILTGFLIGAHALRQADRLLSRDRGFYRSYFRNLRIIDPGG